MWKREIEMSADPSNKSEPNKPAGPIPGKYVYRSNDGDEVKHVFFEITDNNPFHISNDEFRTVSKIFKIEKKDNVIFLARMGKK